MSVAIRWRAVCCAAALQGSGRQQGSSAVGSQLQWQGITVLGSGRGSRHLENTTR